MTLPRARTTRRARLLGAVLVGLATTSAASSAPVCTLVVDARDATVLVRQGTRCDARQSPASTFKLALAPIGYDQRILQDAHAPVWHHKPTDAAWRAEWKQDVDPTAWLRDSVVWVSRDLTAKLGQQT